MSSYPSSLAPALASLPDRRAADVEAWRAIRAALVSRGLVHGRGIFLATSRMGSLSSSIARSPR
jgi:hypothetical protein